MHAAKTGALLSCSSSIGAVLAGGGRGRRRAAGRLRDAGRHRIPGGRRPARHLGPARADGEADLERPAPAQELAAGRRRPRDAVRRGRPPTRAAVRARPVRAGDRRGRGARGGLRRAPPRGRGGRAPPRRWRCASWTAPTSTARREKSSKGSRASSWSASFDDRGGDVGAGDARPRRRPPALAPVSRGLVEGRARDQRDDGRRGSAPAPVPRHPHRASRRSSRPGGSARSSARTAPGPTSTARPADLSTTVEAYVALRLAGDPPDAAHMTPRARSTSSTRAGSSERASSPGSGSRCSGCGRGTTCR